MSSKNKGRVNKKLVLVCFPGLLLFGRHCCWRIRNVFSCVEQKVVVGGQKKLHVFLSEAIGCFFPFFGQCGSREREPCNVPSPDPPWHICNVPDHPIPGTSHVQCANTLRSEAHDICYVPSLVPPWHITWSALARGSVTPNGAPVVGGGRPPKQCHFHIFPTSTI